MTLDTFFEKFDQFADAPNAVAKMRELVLQLAVQGKLIEQDASNEHARELLERKALALRQPMRTRATTVIGSASPLEVEPLFDLPSVWVWVNFGSLPIKASVGIDRGRDQQGPERSYAYFKMNNIKNSGGIDLSNLTRIHATEEEVATYILETGDFLFNTRNSRELVGKTCVFRPWNNEPVLYNNNILRARFADGLSTDFLDFWFRSPIGSAELTKLKSNTTNVCVIYQGHLAGYLCPIPPTAEQKRIVAKVDELMALCNKLEAQQEKRETQHNALTRASLSRFADAPTPANLNLLFHKSYTIPPADLRQTILTLAVQGKLVPQDPDEESAVSKKSTDGEIDYPLNWTCGTVFELATLKSGNSFPIERELKISDYIYVKVSDMNMRQNQHEISTSSRFIMPEPGDLKNLIPGNSIIFPKRGGAIATNKKRLVRSPIFVDSNTMAIICPEYIELDYLHIWFLGIDLWDLNSGTSVPQINNKDIGPLVIPVPPLAEQRRIVAKVAQLMALVDQLESHLATARTSAENLMEAIVAELTTQD